MHALLGENGAGKSTLMNVLYGLLQPDEGEVHLRGEPVHIGSPREAIGLRIGMVHQHFMLIPVMTVAENVVLASEPRKGAMLDRSAAEQRVRELSERFGLSVDPRAYVEDIGVGQQQRVEILRVLHRGADILILDEPTAVLTAQEIEELFGVLRALTAEGVSVIFISHKLREVLEIADRVTVLRRGKKIDTVPTEGATEASLAKLMVGRDVLFRVEKDAHEAGDALLEVDGLEALDDRELPALRGLSLRVRAGEIVGIAGVDGNGQSELVEVITGLRAAQAGHVRVAGRDITGSGVRGALAAGVGHIAEDRHRRGLVLPFSLAENLALRDYRRAPLSRFGWLSPKRMDQQAEPLLEQYDVRGGEPETLASSLSGGNQQKVVIARELAEEPTGHDRRAADARARRRRDRVRPPAAARAARRGPRRAARVAGARGDPLAQRPRAGDLRGPDRGRAVAGRLGRGARRGDARRAGLVMTLMGSGDEGGQAPVTVASRLSGYIRGGGIIVPVITALFAFFVGGIVVALAGANPIDTYKAIFDGSGLNWLFPWVTGDDRTLAALNLQQTLILTTPLILTGLAVAFAFRAGLFNIGGQGQYLVGSMGAVWVGSSFEGMSSLLHIVLAIAAGCLIGGLWAGIAGLLKATTGANEVISTIMLNWTAVYLGSYLFGLGGPLQNSDPTQQSIPVSNDVVQGARLPVFWGDPELQGLHIGIFIALFATILFWILLNRSVTGYEVRAVGFNPDAAEYGGISAGRNYVKVMFVCGVLAGLAGALDVLGWQFRLATNDIQISQVGFFGIAVALLGRNTAGGTVIAALLFGALLNGTSVRNLDPTIFAPELATNLTYIIQGLIVLFVSAPVLVTVLTRGRFRRKPKPMPKPEVMSGG